MPTEGQGSVTHYIQRLRAGDHEAARRIWERFYARMVRLARDRLRAAHHEVGIEDEEDAAARAFHCFYRGISLGSFPRLSDREDLWRILYVITKRKAYDQVRRQMTLKGGGARLIGTPSLGSDPTEGEGDMDRLISREPAPDLVAMMAERCRRLLDILDHDKLRQFALWKMEGYTNEEIARRSNCSLRTVANKLKLIRMIWQRESSWTDPI